MASPSNPPPPSKWKPHGRRRRRSWVNSHWSSGKKMKKPILHRQGPLSQRSTPVGRCGLAAPTLSERFAAKPPRSQRNAERKSDWLFSKGYWGRKWRSGGFFDPQSTIFDPFNFATALPGKRKGSPHFL
jgi:hypothetical protein